MSSDKFQNRYRISSSRLKKWNYANAAGYYVTICTRGRVNYFGEIKNKEISLSAIGKIAHDEWLKTGSIRKDMNLMMDEFVIMPNHVHGIIFINENKFNSGGVAMDNTGEYKKPSGEEMQDEGDDNPTGRDAMQIEGEGKLTRRDAMQMEEEGNLTRRDAMHRVSTDKNTIENYSNRFGPQRKNLSSIIRGYKSAVTTFARKNNLPFNWQERFYERIIRNADEYYAIKKYILLNIENWEEDNLFIHEKI